MTNTLKTTALFLCSILIWGCCEEVVEPKEEILHMNIFSQADIDFICDNLPEGDTFSGNITVSTQEELNFKCLSQIKHVKGSLLLEGPNISLAFKNIVSVTEGEAFSICDNAVDTMYFPNLKTVDTGLGITISSGCNFDNVLFIPNIEILTGLGISFPFFETISRSGTLKGFNLIEEMDALHIDTGSNLSENIKIDGFYNLRKVMYGFRYFNLNKNTQITDNSFSNLEEASFIEIFQLPYPDYYTDITIEEILPKLKKTNSIFLSNFPLKQVCYLRNHIESGEINQLVIRDFPNSTNYGNKDVLEMCE